MIDTFITLMLMSMLFIVPMAVAFVGYGMWLLLTPMGARIQRAWRMGELQARIDWCSEVMEDLEVPYGEEEYMAALSLQGQTFAELHRLARMM